MNNLTKCIKRSVRFGKTQQCGKKRGYIAKTLASELLCEPKRKRRKCSSYRTKSPSDSGSDCLSESSNSNIVSVSVRKKWYELDTMIKVFQYCTCNELHNIANVCKCWQTFLATKPCCWKNDKSHFHMKNRMMERISDYLKLSNAISMSQFAKRFQCITSLTVQIGMDPFEKESVVCVPFVFVFLQVKHLKKKTNTKPSCWTF